MGAQVSPGMHDERPIMNGAQNDVDDVDVDVDGHTARRH